MNTIPTQQKTILVVEDEQYVRESLTAYLDDINYKVLAAENGQVALELFRSLHPDIVMTDLRMPVMDGFALVEAIAAESEFTPIVVVSGVGAVDEAVRAMRMGAWDYLSKPIVNLDELQITLERSLERARTKYELERLRRHLLAGTLENETAFGGIVTTSARMRAIFLYLESVAPSRQPVLISGETGTGKEQIARAVHSLSGVSGPFVAINLAGLDDVMFSDTLFGHQRGAYTGADRSRDGLIRQASGGTLFLDEIGDLSPGSQVKLLRLLQEGEYLPLGADKVQYSDARIVAATHADLKRRMEAGTFRPDLYYRLCSHRVELPPLRERPEDLPLLTAHFLEKAAARLGKPLPVAPPELNNYLAAYRFPGNIRELESIIHDAVARSGSRILSLESVVAAIGSDLLVPESEASAAGRCPVCLFGGKFPTLKGAEEFLIAEALRLAGNNQRLAATYLGITRQALNKRLGRAGE
ncbi:MAG: sigma-54 dependent transcriptional regulator [Desulfuromonadaceae bacterium]|nr:sigma-54 dependent transcriptional regulator [Desulfuromonadaceae bacterium]MDD2847538.1 sigma-54 dependent transcriptional regulator [Desulfuromonadaceae bacterium]MDD4131349.1 sigma-54 dependent transcriptional regulator [Desulfuromonadaceae bacterium]